jgi:hypothetical protein
MSHETSSSIIKDRVNLFNNLQEELKQSVAKDHQVSLKKLAFHKASHVPISDKNPTGNPALVSITGYVAGPRGLPPARWVPHPVQKWGGHNHPFQP